jgi:hypothetical protein
MTKEKESPVTIAADEPKHEGSVVKESPKPAKPITMAYLNTEIETLKQIVLEQGQQIAGLQEALSRKRKPVASNGKVQIRDKQTGKVYPSKNNAYQSLLRAGELKNLVDKGVFGPVPEKNTFGWYALVRELPDRFEEILEQEKEPEHQSDQS